MYMDPTAQAGLWTQVVAEVPTVRLLVANPNSGAGSMVDSAYTAIVTRAETAGATVVGYVHTSCGARSISTVEADVDAWYSFYPTIEGIFVDEVATDTPTAMSYYSPLYRYVKGKRVHPLARTQGCCVRPRAHAPSGETKATGRRRRPDRHSASLRALG
jgi:hypothetical protein